MSFFDDASLVFLPSGQAGKDGKAYSMKPTNGDGDFTFSRGSNLTATRVDSNGLIEKGRENLLENSVWDGVTTNTKPTGWAAQSVSGTGTFDVTATEGQIRFQTLDASSRAFIYSPTITTNGIVVVSVYVDEVTTAIPLEELLSRSANATFLLAYEDGVEINYYSDNVQAGKRYSVVFNKTASTNFRFGVGTSNQILGDVVLSRPQVEVGLVATEWITSPIGSKGKAGILEDSPRFDYSGGASCPNLLLEGSRTNLITQSEYFGGEFSLDNVSLDYNYGTSPEGVTNSALLTQTGSSSSNSMYEFNLPTTDGSYAYSFFFKAGTSTNCRMYVATGIAEDFNPQTITAGYSGGTLNILFEDYGDGWWRASATKTLSAASTNRFSIYPDRNNQGRNIEIWGAQVEQGSYPTSYIPNHSGGSVTREADDSTLSSIINGDAAFTFMIESGIQDYGSSVPKYFDAGALGYINHNTSNILRYRFGGSNYVQSISGLDSFKFLLRYDRSEIKVYFNGSLEHTISASLSGSIGLSLLGGLNKQVLLFPTDLPLNQCITLTS